MRSARIVQTLVRVDQPVPEDLPEEIRAYLVETLPPARVGRACAGSGRRSELFETWGIQIAVCLFCASLPSSYAAAKGVKVLYLAPGSIPTRAGG